MEGLLNGIRKKELERAEGAKAPARNPLQRNYYFVAGDAGVAEVAAVVFFAVFAFL